MYERARACVSVCSLFAFVFLDSTNNIDKTIKIEKSIYAFVALAAMLTPCRQLPLLLE